jgi:shikimate dehydrogenase
MKEKSNTDINLCGLIGYPLKHSISPQMHNTAFDALDLNFVYFPLEVKKSSLKDVIVALKELNFCGVNVTIPHKESIVKFLDVLDTSAVEVGAVNTILNKKGKLVGYNTDIIGFLKTLRKFRIKTNRENVVILGTGGVAKAVAVGLLKNGASVTVVGRNMQKCTTFAKRFQRLGQIKSYTFSNIENALSNAHIVVNCTPIGMYPDIENSPLKKNSINRDMVIFDLVYNPIKTKLLRFAKEKGAKAISGIDMLVYQGAESFELWTGKKAPIEVMTYAALTNLQEFDEK